METEIWKDIPGYEGKYQASNLGNIRIFNYRRILWKLKLKKINTKIQNNLTEKEKNEKKFSYFILGLFFVFLIIIIGKMIIDFIS